MNKILKDDLYRYVGKRNNRLLVRLRYIFFTPGFQYIYFLRHVQTASNILTKTFWNICLKLCSFKFGIQIPASTKIDRGFRIVHFGTIVVNPDATIGRNFNISQGCLIGNSEGKNAGVPTIGNNVCMNANSIVIGNVKIGNDVIIAPGAFVNFNVPDNSIVIGNPGKIVRQKESPTKKYIVYPV